jgi:hypothetical protein
MDVSSTANRSFCTHQLMSKLLSLKLYLGTINSASKDSISNAVSVMALLSLINPRTPVKIMSLEDFTSRQSTATYE